MNTYTLIIYSPADGGAITETVEATNVGEACTKALHQHYGAGEFEREDFELVAAIDGVPTWSAYETKELPINEFPGA